MDGIVVTTRCMPANPNIVCSRCGELDVIDKFWAASLLAGILISSCIRQGFEVTRIRIIAHVSFKLPVLAVAGDFRVIMLGFKYDLASCFLEGLNCEACDRKGKDADKEGKGDTEGGFK